MNLNLKEVINRGTLLFPFQHYDMKNTTGNIFVSYHWHDDIEIIYQFKGSSTLFMNGVSYELSTGDIYFINKATVHNIISNDINCHYYAYVFPLESLSFIINDYSQNKFLTPILENKLLFPICIPENCKAKIKTEIKYLININKKQSLGYQLLTKASLYKIIAFLFQENLLTNNKDAVSDIFQKELLMYLNSNYSNKISLNEISDKFHISPKYFCKYFKKCFGKTFIGYLNHIRIQNACILLVSTKMTVIEISMTVGFENISYFIRCFKKNIGITPNTYRHKNTQS